jgi:hypothetical protein
MENLLQKIKEYTAQGSPSVGQLIELNDLAKKVGVKRNELDKLITQYVAEQKQDDFQRNPIIQNRTDYSDSTRNAETQRPIFEDRRAIFERKEDENRNFDSSSFGTSTFEKKVVSYEETNRNFENANKTSVKNTHYPDSKEREKEVIDEQNKTKNATLTVEQKLANVATELHLAVNARKIQGLKAYTENEFFELTNIIRQKYGLHKLQKPIMVEEIEEIEIEEAPTIQAVVFDAHLDDDLKVDAFEFEEPVLNDSKLSYDQKIGEIKKEIQRINASNFFNGYAIKIEEYIALHNQLFEKHGLPKIKRIEECIVPLPEVDVTKSTQTKNPTQQYEQTSSYSQSKEEIERQLNIVKKKEAEKQAEFEKKERQKKQLEELNNKEKAKQILTNDIKGSRVMAFVALGLSLFIVAIAGVILGGITLIRLGEQNKKLTNIGANQDKSIMSILNTARTVAIFAFIVGLFQLIRDVL